MALSDAVGWTQADDSKTNACVEVMAEYGNVLIRSSSARSFWVSFNDEEWTTFVEAVKTGKFDL
jgi:hypothetical protein